MGRVVSIEIENRVVGGEGAKGIWAKQADPVVTWWVSRTGGQDFLGESQFI